MAAEFISKTSFLKFEQCPKALYFYKRLPHLADPPDASKKMTFLRGHEVGRFARDLYPGGQDASEGADDAASIVKSTAELLATETPVIYEAGFVYRNALVIVDILRRDRQGWWAYEVKSSLKVSENYLKDACLQYYVLRNALPDFRDLYLVTINPDFRLDGKIDPKKYFVRRSMKTRAEKNLEYFSHRLSEANETLERDVIPDVPIGKHCFRPYRCEFFGTCWDAPPGSQSIFNLPLADRTTMLEWHDAGIRDIGDIPEALIRRESLQKIRQAYLSHQPYIEADKIRQMLSNVQEPAAAFDMEIWNPALPQLPGSKPFEQIPFLACLYDGQTLHSHFATQSGDPRHAFAVELIRMTRDYKTLLVYDGSLEAIVLRDLAARFPELQDELAMIRTKMVDIFEIFLKLAYYHPKFRSNFSLKVVSTVLLNEVLYPGIESGLEAMKLYSDYRNSENELEKETLRSALVDYCSTDVTATFRLYRFLTALTGGQGNSQEPV